VRAYKDQFALDRRTLLDVLDAQNELFVSRTNAINAEFLEMFSVFRLLALRGDLLPTMNVAFPRESNLIDAATYVTDR
jgi:adhesin transport system outer membrane protein